MSILLLDLYLYWMEEHVLMWSLNKLFTKKKESFNLEREITETNIIYYFTINIVAHNDSKIPIKQSLRSLFYVFDLVCRSENGIMNSNLKCRVNTPFLISTQPLPHTDTAIRTSSSSLKPLKRSGGSVEGAKIDEKFPGDTFIWRARNGCGIELAEWKD